MGFKIRDKSLFWTISGWKNNWEPKILNMPRMIKSNQTAYLTCRYDHHSYLRSNFGLYFSGAVLQKLFENIKTIRIWRFKILADINPRIEKCLQNSIRMLNSCLIDKARWCNSFIYFRKEEWLISSIEIMN
jgi:hypothetical protein